MEHVDIKFQYNTKNSEDYIEVDVSVEGDFCGSIVLPSKVFFQMARPSIIWEDLANT